MKMKRWNYLLVALFVMSSIVCVSCSKDDDDPATEQSGNSNGNGGSSGGSSSSGGNGSQSQNTVTQVTAFVVKEYRNGKSTYDDEKKKCYKIVDNYDGDVYLSRTSSINGVIGGRARKNYDSYQGNYYVGGYTYTVSTSPQLHCTYYYYFD